MQTENIPTAESYQKVYHGINATGSKSAAVLSQSRYFLCNARPGKVPDAHNGNGNAYHQNQDENISALDSEYMPEGELRNIASQGLENYQLYRWNYKVHDGVGEAARLYSLSERLEVLTNYKHIEHEPVNEPGLVERLPPEVLLVVFSHLDDVSLWSAANVCRRWCGLLSTHITSQQWQQNVKLRWPLYKPIGYVKNWYKVYDFLASSAPCRICLAQTCLRSRPPRMEENSWRRNRLHSELKSLRIDPPEGIQATPLDQMCCHWQATITGPVGSPYEGGLFYLYLQVPCRYVKHILRFLFHIKLTEL